MNIDTRYKTGEKLVFITLETPEERALTNDQLARVGCNQHRLRWEKGFTGEASLDGLDPSTFRLPLVYRKHRVERSNGGGNELARVIFKMPAAVNQ